MTVRPNATLALLAIRPVGAAPMRRPEPTVANRARSENDAGLATVAPR